jgi:hypothetical protein
MIINKNNYKHLNGMFLIMMMPSIAYASSDPTVVYILAVAVMVHIYILVRVLLIKDIDMNNKAVRFIITILLLAILWAGILATKLPYWLVCILLIALPIIVFMFFERLTKRYFIK